MLIIFWFNLLDASKTLKMKYCVTSPVGEPDVLDLSDSSDATIFYQKDLYSTGFPMMESIRREGKLCDVTLTVGEHSLAAHRIVLAANIPYFR